MPPSANGDEQRAERECCEERVLVEHAAEARPAPRGDQPVRLLEHPARHSVAVAVDDAAAPEVVGRKLDLDPVSGKIRIR